MVLSMGSGGRFWIMCANPNVNLWCLEVVIEFGLVAGKRYFLLFTFKRINLRHKGPQPLARLLYISGWRREIIGIHTDFTDFKQA